MPRDDTSPAAPSPAQLAIFGEPPGSPIEPAGGGATARPGPAPALLELPDALARYRSLLRLGTSTWSFPGWQGLIYDEPVRPHSEARLSRDGLSAYAAHPLLGAAGIDRSFHAPVQLADYRRYASQVPAGFRFLVKAPARVTDAVRRDAHGRGREPNPDFLDAGLAGEAFVEPAVQGLGDRLGTLLLQFPPLPAAWVADPRAGFGRLRRFLCALPRPLPEGAGYAVELRDPALLTPRLMDLLRDLQVDYCVGLHDRMPPVERQLRALDHHHRGAPGPLLARWTLHTGIDYEAARRRYAPFRELVDPDPVTREGLAARAAATLQAGHPVTVIANNKAEGSAPRTLLLLAEAIATVLRSPQAPAPA